MGDGGHVLEGGERAGGGFGVDHADHLDVVLPADCVAEPLRVDHGAPFVFDALDSHPDSGGNVLQPTPEEAVDRNDEGVAGL